ncbi:hypothetical protein CA13_11330 [Planctomycetes bacterium CA13]|uniref:Uncharacterized protein n=1 Tax=Novipirellula herctigrandis TaxID=2527986 RepID=A0A5C5YYG8_9BACT|nr:hypothetical protein CA13_11330 [Planctomycetes bacterium CA13]
MKHMLKIDAFILLFSALGYLIAMLTSDSSDGILLLPLVLLSIVVCMGLLEVDRRLNALEQSQPDTDPNSLVE